MTFTQCWCYYASHTTKQQPAIHPASMNSVFASCSEEDIMYPLTVKKFQRLKKLTPVSTN